MYNSPQLHAIKDYIKVLAKIKQLVSNEGAMFFVSNMIFSFSTYLIALLIPYKLNTQGLADFSAAFNIVILLIFVFEFGLSVSYLRYNQLYKIADQINAVLQLMIFTLLLIFATTFLGSFSDLLFGTGSIGIKQEYIYLSIFALLTWNFFKNTMLAKKRIKFIIINSFAILAARIVILAYILLSDTTIILDNIFLYLFVVPFLIVIFFNMREIFRYLVQSRSVLKNSRYWKLFYKRTKQFVAFSALTYIINGLFVYTNRYAIVYLADNQMTKVLAEIGYALTFSGLILIFITSLRSYFISKFNISNTQEIIDYIATLKSYKMKFIVLGAIASVAVAGMVNVIKPSYLTFDSVIYVFILIYASVIIAYLSLYSLLSKTFNFNKLELTLNIIRLILVILAVHFIFAKYPIIGFAVINFMIIAVELYFAKTVVKRVLSKNNNIKEEI